MESVRHGSGAALTVTVAMVREPIERAGDTMTRATDIGPSVP